MEPPAKGKMNKVLQFLKKTGIVLLLVIGGLFFYATMDKSPSEDELSAELIAWRSSAEVFENNGHKLSYHDSKSGAKGTIVLMHGYPASSYDWHLLWDGLKTNYRVIAMDWLGYGFSDKPGDLDYSVAHQADILEALLQHLGIRDAHLMAHDYGDNIAQELLARDNERQSQNSFQINSLVLLNGALFPETFQPTRVQSYLNGSFGGLVSAFSNSRLFKNNYTKVFGGHTLPTEQDLTDQWYLICQQNGHKINHKLMHIIDDRTTYRERWVGALTSTKVPTLFINGLKDPVSGQAVLDRYVELVPNPRTIEMNAIGHCPHLEDPEAVARHYWAFLKEIEDQAQVE